MIRMSPGCYSPDYSPDEGNLELDPACFFPSTLSAQVVTMAEEDYQVLVLWYQDKNTTHRYSFQDITTLPHLKDHGSLDQKLDSINDLIKQKKTTKALFDKKRHNCQILGISGK